MLFVTTVPVSFYHLVAGYLQDVIYKLSKVGQAIEKSDLSTANSVLGSNTNADWVQNASSAFTKVSFILFLLLISSIKCLFLWFMVLTVKLGFWIPFSA